MRKLSSREHLMLQAISGTYGQWVSRQLPGSDLKGALRGFRAVSGDFRSRSDRFGVSIVLRITCKVNPCHTKMYETKMEYPKLHIF